MLKALTQHYGTRPGNSALKFLVTSRPYLRIQREFQDLKEAQPTIHLSGESEDEVDKIEQEIAICINQRTEDICKYHQLSLEEKKIIQDELAAVKNRTYLWAHLVFAAIEDAVFLSRDDLLIIQAQPERFLHIVVAANRPLLPAELAAILAFREESHRSHKDLERDILQSEKLAGFLEFLIRGPSKLPESCASLFDWEHSLDLEDSHRLFSEVCVRYLLLHDVVELGYNMWLSRFALLSYAACEWASHYRQACKTQDGLDQLALQLCEPEENMFSTWMIIYESEIRFELTTPLLVASYFGLNNLVGLILQKDKRSLSRRSQQRKRTALSYASEKRHDSAVRILLEQVPKHRIILRKMLPLHFSTIIDRKDNFSKTPLYLAASNGHHSIFQKLLQQGARVNDTDIYGLTPLFWAAFYGYDDIVSLLLAHDCRSPLLDAALDGDNAAVKLWLDSGANTEAVDDRHMTALLIASRLGNLETTKLLLDAGANINAEGYKGYPPLMVTLYNRNSQSDDILKLLLDHGAVIDATDRDKLTALIHALDNGNLTKVRLPLDHGAKVDMADIEGITALMHASKGGYNDVAESLLVHGAKVDKQTAGVTNHPLQP
ncbi:hypothetical protein RRF57_013328 [Xylaria bambusicola]|uniref:Uncharacterized protein n=1 Tax=Xylaria bambusicola TaxID=326684 RepID=A0AAN7ZFE5_9PEZI